MNSLQALVTLHLLDSKFLAPVIHFATTNVFEVDHEACNTEACHNRREYRPQSACCFKSNFAFLFAGYTENCAASTFLARAEFLVADCQRLRRNRVLLRLLAVGTNPTLLEQFTRDHNLDTFGKQRVEEFGHLAP